MATQLRKGSRLGKYRLDRRLDRGGFAEVWKARDTVEGRTVALKVALREAVEEWGREEIEREARIASQLHHPNVVAVRNADWIDGRFAIATDLAMTSLEHYGRARRSAKVALEVIRQVAAGLAYAHRRRLIHRDVKPGNILIFADGHAAIGDFGSSRFTQGATRTYTDAGTLGYMAPEQAYGRVRFASDVFSLGLIATELLTGRLPTWPFEWPPPDGARFDTKVPEPLRAVLRRAQAFDPRRRYEDAVAFSEALERAFEAAESQPRARRRKRPAPPPSALAVQAALFRRAHGRALGMRYACHRCEGPIAESMIHCPWCGSPDNSFQQVTRAALVCPECERSVRPEWRFCPWCYAGRFRANGRRPPPDPAATRRCTTPGCDGQLRPFMRYCPMCKRKTKRLWSHAHLPDRCPRCRWPTDRSQLRFCPWCGRREPKAGSFQRGR
ncbi:MAG TPA: serine/threonine-protein kinase [Myxococcota bacterium]|nr:serine/threonine-protein kinase [Myxococcota bacterium]